MKLLHKLFPLGHLLICLLFIGCGLALITFAGLQLWQGIQPWGGLALDQRLHTVLDSIAVLTVAVAACRAKLKVLGHHHACQPQGGLAHRVRAEPGKSRSSSSGGHIHDPDGGGRSDMPRDQTHQ